VVVIIKAMEVFHGNDQDFVGTWKTGGGSFTMGDSIRFNSDYTCDFFWSHNTNILSSGTWDRTYKNQVGYVVVITLNDIETTYKYDFFDSYKTLRLKLEDSDEYIYILW
jgi:hypothetical protein